MGLNNVVHLPMGLNNVLEYYCIPAYKVVMYTGYRHKGFMFEYC